MCSSTCGAACTRTLNIKGADPSCASSSFGSITLSLVSVRDYDQKVTCPNSKSICDNMGCATAGTFSPGVERYEFQGTVNIGATSGIPATCCNVRFVFEECCRSGQISTGSTWQNFYVDAVINRCHSVSPCNSSPTFTTEPYDIVCGGEPVLYNNGTIEPDRDSLSFEFTPALQGFGSSVTYDPPFAYNKPMPWTGNDTAAFPAGIHCDPRTGDIMFTPGNTSGSNFTGVIAIAVKQWKTISGVPTVIGTTRRDIQMVIGSNCLPNNGPIITTIPADTGASGLNPKLSWEVCEGSQLCFDIVSRDKDTISATIWDTTYLRWDSALASKGATFLPNYVDSTRKITGPREDSYKFCWTPPVGSASNTPYIMVIKNNDNKCPIPGRNSRGFSIKVSPKPLGSINKTSFSCGRYQLSINNTQPNFPITSVRWKIAKAPFDNSFAAGADTFNIFTTPILKFNAPGKYLVEVSINNNNCSNVQYDTLMIDTVVQTVAMKDTLVCSGNSITLNATAQYGSAPYSFRWFNSIKDTTSPALNAPIFSSSNFTVAPTVSKTYTIQVRDVSGCRAYDSVFVLVNKGVKNTALTHIKCNGENSGSIVMNMLDTMMPYQYRINSGTYQSSKQFTGLISGVYSVEAKDTNNCSSIVNGLGLAQPFMLKDTLTRVVNNQTCHGLNNGQLTTKATGGTSPYRYSLDSVIFKSNGLYSNLAPGTYKVHILDTNNCYTSVTQTITPVDSFYLTSTTQNPTCFGKNTGEIRVQATGGTPPYLYRLGTFGPYVNDSIFENLIAGTYTISVEDKNLCMSTITKTITSPTRMMSTSGTTQTSCFGLADGTAIIHTTGGTTPYQFRVGMNGVLSSDSAFSNLAGGSHQFYTIDNASCLDSVVVTIPQPLQTLAVLNTVNPSCFGKTDGIITVNVTQGKAPMLFALDAGTFGSNSTFTNLGGNAYTVTVKDSSGCLSPLSTTLTTPPQIIAGSLSGNTTVIQNTSETYSITPQAGLNYVWGVQKGHIISGQYTSGVNVNWDSIGTGQIGVIIYSDTTCGDTASLIVNIGVNGLDESAKLIGLEVYPNPTTGILNINLRKLPTNNPTLKLYDAKGKLIIQQELKISQQLHLQDLPLGLYMLRVGELKGKIITR